MFSIVLSLSRYFCLFEGLGRVCPLRHKKLLRAVSSFQTCYLEKFFKKEIVLTSLLDKSLKSFYFKRSKSFFVSLARQIRSKVTYCFCVSSHKNCIKQIAERRRKVEGERIKLFETHTLLYRKMEKSNGKHSITNC